MEPEQLTLRVDFGCLYPSDLAPRSLGGHVHRHPAPLAQPHADVGATLPTQTGRAGPAGARLGIAALAAAGACPLRTRSAA
jgi:hypothetical protein